MEHCCGRTLEDLRCDDTVSGKTLMEVALLVTRQVARLHARGFAHNDVKTDNCVADVSATPFTVRLIDFGNSTRLGESPCYDVDPEGMHLAPELCRSGVATSATDVFSLGTLLKDLMEMRPDDAFPKMLPRLARSACKEDPKRRPSMALFTEALEAVVAKMGGSLS